MSGSLSRRNLMLIAGLGSAALLAGAFLFQALGYAPCKMCYWQRYPHVAAALIGLTALFGTSRLLAAGGALAATITAVLGVYHVGVEQKLWEGPSSCTGGGGGLAGLSGAELLSTDTIDKVVMCDEVSWALFGISMPGWNAIFSALLVVVWIVALRRPV